MAGSPPAAGWMRGASRTLSLAIAGLVAAAVAQAADSTLEQAHFVVGSEVINPALQPFTVTAGQLGNGVDLSRESGGFEPHVYRTMFVTTADADNRIIAPRAHLSKFDSLRSGALDGAEVEVLRIENGVFRSVRRDRIAPGGFQVSEWIAVDGNKGLPARQTSYDFAWDKWNRSGVPYYFTVRAVDRHGNLSEAADAVSAVKPDTVARPEADGGLIRLELSGQISDRFPAPENLRARVLRDGVVRLEWDAVPGAAGYVVYRADEPPEAQHGSYIQLEGPGPAIRAGDLVILRHVYWQPDRQKLLSNRVWDSGEAKKLFGIRAIPGWPDETGNNWHLMPHTPDAPVPGGGAGFLRAEMKPGEQLVVGYFNHAGLEQSFYPVLDPGRDYRFEVWLRGDAQTPVRFELVGPYDPGGPTPVPPVETRVGPDWTRFTGTFRVPAVATSSRAGRMQLVLTGPGRIDVDNFRVFPAEVPFLDLAPEDAARLGASGMGMLRLHRFGRTTVSTYDLAELTNPAGASNIGGGQTLPQMLSQTAGLGMDPWLQIEPHLSREEWLGLAEFLAAPFDPARDGPAERPWAAKRVAEGHPAPWTDDFGQIYLELGNETWNRLFYPWVFRDRMPDAATGQSYSNGAVYGMYQEYVLGILRQSPYWPRLADKLVPVLGGWTGQNYGAEAARVSPSSDAVTIAAYIGGWDEGAGPVRPTPEGFSSVLTHVLQTGLPRAEKLAGQVADLPGRAGPIRTGTYEAGPGYALNGLNGTRVTPEQAAEQEQVMKSAAAGAATLDNFLAAATAGFSLQNFFAYKAGSYWASHADWDRGGQAYPSWEWLSLFNREARGDLLAVRALDVPTIDLPEVKRREAVQDGPLVAAYATRSGDRLSLVLISRRVPGYPDPQDDGRTAVTVDLPIDGAQRLTRYRLSGDYDSNNVATAAAVVEEQALPVPDSLPRLDVSELAPGEAMILVFDGIR